MASLPTWGRRAYHIRHKAHFCSNSQDCDMRILLCSQDSFLTRSPTNLHLKLSLTYPVLLNRCKCSFCRDYHINPDRSSHIKSQWEYFQNSTQVPSSMTAITRAMGRGTSWGFCPRRGVCVLHLVLMRFWKPGNV